MPTRYTVRVLRAEGGAVVQSDSLLSVLDAIQIAKQLKARLPKGWFVELLSSNGVMWFTPTCGPAVANMAAIVRSAGGAQTVASGFTHHRQPIGRPVGLEEPAVPRMTNQEVKAYLARVLI